MKTPLKEGLYTGNDGSVWAYRVFRMEMEGQGFEIELTWECIESGKKRSVGENFITREKYTPPDDLGVRDP